VISQPVTPVVVKVVDAPTPETSIADILIGSVGFVGFVLLAAAVVGLVAGSLFFMIRRARGTGSAPVAGAGLNLSSPQEQPPTATPTR
jgi:hypothetical protein